MKPVPKLEVIWGDGSLIGHLVNRGSIYFVYDDSWLANGHDLSPLSLPFVSKPFNGAVCPGGLAGLIADCLPDAWGRRVATSDFLKHGLGEPSTLDLLAWRADRGIGALQFRPVLELHGMASARSERILASTLARGAVEIEKGKPSKVLPLLAKGGSAGGAYPKALVLSYEDGALAVGKPDGIGVPSLLKFDLPGFRAGLSKCEHAFTLMARQAGIRASTTKIVEDGEFGHLLVERFDIGTGGKRLHFHSLSGMLHRDPGALEYDDGFRAIIRLGMERSEVLEWARRMVFNVLSSNADDHGKNHGFIYDAQGKSWSLSPAYDLVYAESMLDRGMRIRGEVWPSVKKMKEVCQEFGIQAEETQDLFEQVGAAISNWTPIAKASGVSGEITKVVAERIVRIAAAVGNVRTVVSGARTGTAKQRG